MTFILGRLTQLSEEIGQKDSWDLRVIMRAILFDKLITKIAVLDEIDVLQQKESIVSAGLFSKKSFR